MPAPVDRRVLLKQRPSGTPRPGDFELAESVVPSPRDGEILCRTDLPVPRSPRTRQDQRGQLSMEPDQVMAGGTVSEVVGSRNSAFARGNFGKLLVRVAHDPAR